VPPAGPHDTLVTDRRTLTGDREQAEGPPSRSLVDPANGEFKIKKKRVSNSSSLSGHGEISVKEEDVERRGEGERAEGTSGFDYCSTGAKQIACRSLMRDEMNNLARMERMKLTNKVA
jgi:hypothetical protein